MSLLEIEGLKTYFHTQRGTVKALDGVSLRLEAGETLGVVGESGCGKTVLALSILRLVPSPPGKILAGRISFNGSDLLSLSPRDMQSLRGREISLIFQEPMTSLNPVFTIGNQIKEVLKTHRLLPDSQARKEAENLLDRVGIPEAGRRLDNYPHQLSGGMRQRVMIAMALACRPKLLIADEPTTALDVTIQAQILNLIDDLKEELGSAVILITHDLGIVAETAQQVAVMYAGKVVEEAAVSRLFRNPAHPYTKGLIACLPRIDLKRDSQQLNPIPGAVPNLYELPSGCAFQERCTLVRDLCRREMPALQAIEEDHRVRCWNVS
jgi:oligopeptide/dipeptide ABC transporter ATP-binding protein